MKKMLAFSGIGIQTLITILLFYFIGDWIDGDDDSSKWKLWMTLFGLLIALYFLVKGMLSVFSDDAK